MNTTASSAGSTMSTGSPTELRTQPAQSVCHMIVNRADTAGDQPAFMAPLNPGWRTITWKEMYNQSEELAAGLMSLGVEREQRVGIASLTSFEWVQATFAIWLSGGATTTIYAQTEPEEASFILNDSKTVLLFAQDDQQVAKYKSQRSELPGVKHIINMEGPGDGDWVLSMADLAQRGRDYLRAHPGSVRERALASTPDNLATLIYTSGTTGRPKGVELLHRNWAYEGAAMEALNILRPDDVQMLWLPLAHSFGSVLLASQLQIGFVTAVDGRVDKIVENLGSVRPTVMASVPRIFEKVHAKVTGDVEHEGGAKAKIANWAFKVGRHVAEERAAGRRPSAGLMAQYRVADKLVFSKIKARMGGRIRYFVSGAAALSTEVNWWFQAAGMTILEGYGLTETSAATTVNRPGRVGIGTVGQPVPGTMIKIADDGEILIKGPGVMRGYHNRPDLTAEVFTDGWFHTGDIGYVDNMGRVKITDRKKDLVKTSGGKYVAPSYIESRYKGITKLAMYMVVQAADRNFVTALIALDPDSLTAFAAQNGLSGDFSTLASSPAVLAQIDREVEQLNRGLNPWEQVKKYEVLNRALTIEAGEITPSLKIRRAEVGKNFGSLIDAMYT